MSPSTLRGVVEDFVTRDGTDYGERETSLESKVDQVLALLRSGRASVVYDAESETCSIALVEDLRGR